MSFKEKLDYKMKIIIGIIVLVIGLLFIWFTSGMARSGLVPIDVANYSFFMSIFLLIPSILLLIPSRNEKTTTIIKYFIYAALAIFIIYCLIGIPVTSGPIFGYFIVAMLFILINIFCNYIR
ncbi:MAG: hypothetical protein K6A34_04380 [Methanobrevibacter sp.]|nr:hypothetical protein [Methanobrevibacter sp.]